MNKSKNIFFSIISAVIALIAFVLILFLKDVFYTNNFFITALIIFSGAVIALFIITVIHELGHLIAGIRNNFKFVSINIWFFKWKRVGKRIGFSFTGFGEALGFTEMVPINTDNLDQRFINMTRGGVVANIIFAFLFLIPLFFNIENTVLCIICPFFPLSIYYVLDNFLPTDRNGIRNDGGVIYGIKKEDNESKVLSNILKIQAFMVGGSTPSQVEEKLFFDVPQLPEDNHYFINLLSYRYYFYLDKGDFVNSSKILDRIATLSDYLPTDIYNRFMVEELYKCCTYDLDENRADEITYELDKYLNNVNSVENVRAKLAYALYILKKNMDYTDFYQKGIREAKRLVVKGQQEFEIKLFEKMKKDFPDATNC